MLRVCCAAEKSPLNGTKGQNFLAVIPVGCGSGRGSSSVEDVGAVQLGALWERWKPLSWSHTGKQNLWCAMVVPWDKLHGTLLADATISKDEYVYREEKKKN